MSTSSTITRSPIYLTAQPDWSQGVEIEMQFLTTIFRAHDSTEQRTRRRSAPRYRIKYVLGALSSREFSVRRARAMFETQYPLVIPLWPLRTHPASVEAPVLNFALNLSDGDFRVGYPVYIEEDGVSGFWTVSQIEGSALTLDTEDTALPAFTEAANVWPCMRGIRSQNTALFDLIDPAATDETIEAIDL